MKKRLLLILMLTLTACGVRPTDPIQGGPAPTEELTGPVLYLLNGATLTRVVRPSAQESSLTLLAAGPASDELAEGLTTEIPPDAAPITATTSTDGITVRIASPLRYLSNLARSQLVCTAIPPDDSLKIPVILKDATEELPPQTCPFRA